MTDEVRCARDVMFVRELYEMRVRGLWRYAMTFGIAMFIVGCAITRVLDRIYPMAAAWLLTGAAIVAACNTIYAWIIMVRARRAYQQSLTELRAISPEIAQAVEETLKGIR